MPIYDYLCSNCAERTEVIHGISDPGPRFCPACGAEGTLRKAFAPPAVHFKGSGWAKKDRASTSSPARARTDAGTDKDSKPGSGEGAAAPKDSTATSGDTGSADTGSAATRKGAATGSADAAKA